MPPTVPILALIVGAVGWYYLFYSRGATNLGNVESTAVNLRRRRFRKIDGAIMVLLGGFFYSGFVVDPHAHPRIFSLVWLAVCVLLLFVVIFAMIDLRLTLKLRRKL